ncbi:hypothetical protein TSAR_010238 [Trichomalopsis sarcophagae]|uniref:Uncharacterized protein n=1 Tax=Trichomalopsis sarcophagae TaxID=543379 RepID=A0A232F0H1_9HYME|nr:hypothetical protein TSAR_010238 [Trichomalopsis sarcophagae]
MCFNLLYVICLKAKFLYNVLIVFTNLNLKSNLGQIFITKRQRNIKFCILKVVSDTLKRKLKNLVNLENQKLFSNTNERR